MQGANDKMSDFGLTELTLITLMLQQRRTELSL